MIKMLSFLMVAVIAVPAYAGEAVDLSKLAKDIRNGKIDVGTEYSVDYNDDRFHKIHADTLGLNCSTCHAGKQYQPDFVLLRKYEEEAGEPRRKLDRAPCLGCHQAGGIATTWYSGRATK